MGFDPGLTAGIAILDLQGKILSVTSFKEISRAEIIKHIINYGKAILISTDVYPPPKMVKKLSSTLNAKIHHPDKDMSVGSKIELVETYLGEKSSQERSKAIVSEEMPQNAHERDALAAAIRTYKSYQKKLLQIENRAEKIGLSQKQIESIKLMVITGTAISTAIQKLMETKDNPDKDIKSSNFSLLTEKNSTRDKSHISSFYASEPILDDSNSTILKLKSQIRIQKKQISNLKTKSKALECEIEEYKTSLLKLQDKINKLHYEYAQDILQKKEIASKISLIKKLQDNYNEEKALRVELENNLKSLKNIQVMKPSKNAIPVKIIETFTRDGINEACEYWKIKRGDVVLLKSSEGGGSHTASLLIQMGVTAVLIMDKISHYAKEEFEKNMVPLLQVDSRELKMIDQFAIINAPHLEKEIDKWKARIENKKNRENTKEILKVFDEYRAKRKRLVDNS